MYALNANGLVHSAKLSYINTVINARNPHAFVLSESKTNTPTAGELPPNYTVYEEPGVQAENHHIYKWGVAVGIRKGIQIEDRVKIDAAALKGRVVALDIILKTNNGENFRHRVIGAYAPWDPGLPNTSDFWPELTKLCQSTTSSWTLGGDLNATVSASERASGGAEARSQFLAFLARTDAHDIWTNYPDRNRNYNWTSRAKSDSTSGNIIDRIVSSKRSLIDSEIAVADHSKDFVPFTNHRAVVAKIVYTCPSGSGQTIFPAYHAVLNKARIKYPMCMEKHRHDDFRNEMDSKVKAAGLLGKQVTDDTLFLDVYESFTDLLIPAAEKCYGRVTRRLRRTDDRIMNHKIEKIVAQLRFTGGAIRTIRDPNTPNMSHGAQLTYNRLITEYYARPSQDGSETLLQFATLRRRQLHRQLFAERVAEIKARKEKYDCYRITVALKGGSTKRLVRAGEFIELPVTVIDPLSDKLVSDPSSVKRVSREYWSNLYHHNLPPNIPKPWLTTKSVLAIQKRVQNDPFVWPRSADLADFRALLHKGTPRPAPGRDQWEKWLIKNLSDRALQIVLQLHNYIITTSRFPGDLKDMWLTMFHKRGLRTDLANWRGL
ncbi:hypothetical protein B0H17DRAFT_1191498 [Mycena rosella]|uniref:Uncharacterized protein n=1 Tax=Mycena rosella TaxID=1033263 RepID=A0AAD7MBC4_MYCRO|nr:hypothetical protein B0H17DRAFT_1191498 [Mycena rosella]